MLRPLLAAREHLSLFSDDTAESESYPWQPTGTASSPSPGQPAQIAGHHKSEVSVSMATEQMSGNLSLFVHSENRMGGAEEGGAPPNHVTLPPSPSLSEHVCGGALQIMQEHVEQRKNRGQCKRAAAAGDLQLREDEPSNQNPLCCSHSSACSSHWGIDPVPAIILLLKYVCH